jgi:predicted ATP-grasp superfamily ATP-dependent carboligase
MSILYAADVTTITEAIAWPHWVADRPAAGTIIAANAPVCTVLASAASATAARRLLAARETTVRSMLHEQSARPTLRPANRVKTRSGSTA